MVTGYYVAVDGGNSKTDVLIGDTTGRILARVRGGGSSPFHLGFDGTIALLDKLITDAQAQAGGVPLDRAALYLAGADLPHEVAALQQGADGAHWAASHLVDNDTFALLRAGTDAPDAIAVVCGAGTNCVGRAADGRTARFPALGEITGDWGGGHHLARLALWHAVRGEDGRGPATALTAAVAAHFGRGGAEAVGVALHLGEIDVDRVPELSPLLFTVAEAGDAVALAVIEQQAEEIVAQATVAARRLDLLDKPHAVVLGGGVLQSEQPLLLAGIRSRLVPAAEPVVVTSPPVLGAALLALDALGASVESHALLRSAF
ncbi:BadF/BadG/BcrA/BcrD ATPase family protein [Longispora sp. K20-0274]|uniref:N-acetylglucosamine kinase n=1 Tax=Longispora sp. K20-0274 TaxID=3088255 RepID=UPI00399A0470